MDVLQFINSKSIAKYLANIGYEFNALESAYLVWQCKTASIYKKLSAWEEIINTMPDMSVKKRYYIDWKGEDVASLHAFLRKVIRSERKCLDCFYQKDDKSLYSYEVWRDFNVDMREDHRIFSSLEECKKAIDKDPALCDAVMYSITKRVPNANDWIGCIFLKNGDVYNTYGCLATYTWFFEGLWLNIPTPFRRGDILRQISMFELQAEPFVLKNMCTWGEKELRENRYTNEVEIEMLDQHKTHERFGDKKDMCAQGYFMNRLGTMYSSESFVSYLDLDYYEGELNGELRFLTALSNYEKGIIDVSILANAYVVFTDEMRDEGIKKGVLDSDYYLKLTGLKNDKSGKRAIKMPH